MRTAALALIVILSLGTAALADDDRPRRGRAVVTPYGDFCSRCSLYGTGRRPVKMHEAVDAAGEYFRSKGLTVGDTRGHGRFIIMDIYRDDEMVDRVVFDRRTGRIRSIY
jgi:hypothetical protein